MNKNYEEWLGEGNTLYGLGKYDEAISCYDKAIEINPEDANAWNYKSIALQKLGKYDEAINYCDTAIEIKPEDANSWNGKGNALLNLRKFDKAIECYDKSIEINPEDANAWNNKGIALQNLGKYDEAIECYDKAIEIDPNNADAWKNKGNTLQNLGKNDETIECYSKAIEIDPEHADIWNNEYISLQKLEKYDKTIECYDKAIEINPEDANALNGKVNALLNLGKYDETIEWYDNILKLDSRNADAINGKEVCISSINRSEEAHEKTHELNPQETNIKVTSAFGYQGATILFKVKIENCTKKPIAKIRVYPQVPDVFILKENEKSIDLIEPASSQTVTFGIRPTGECGQCNISGRVNYYDMVSMKHQDIELEGRALNIICPMLQRKEISEEAWRELVSGLAKAEEIPSVVFIGGVGLFGMITEILKGRNLFALSPVINKSPQIFYGNGKFYGEGIKGLKYAAQIEVQGGVKKSKLILTAWAEKEDSLTGFYHSILEQIEKRIKVKDIEDEIIQQNIQNIHYGDRIGNKFEGDVIAVRSNIGIAARKCPNCEREIKENEIFCPGCGSRVN